MPLNLRKPILYLITGGATTGTSRPGSEEFERVLALVRAATRAGIPLVQLREKNLTARALYELAVRCSEITRGTGTRLLINDRADIARAARADGVQLTTRSLKAAIIRRVFGASFLVGVSTHTLAEALKARDEGADFAVFGPIFDTPSKRAYGVSVGLEALRQAAEVCAPLPLLALGGITLETAGACMSAGASGVAAIRLFSDPRNLSETARALAAGEPLHS